MIKNPLSDEQSLHIGNDTETSNGGIDTHVKTNPLVLNRTRLETPTILDPTTCSFEDIKNHASLRQRLAPRTIQNHLKYLRFMEVHPCPINLRNPSRENFLRHMDYREQVEHAGWGALKHEAEAYRMYLRSIGQDPANYYYKPQRREPRETPIPYPDQVHQMLHARYSKDRYTDALIRYLLCHNHVIGWRPPSEPSIAKTVDVDLDHQTLVITSPKLHGRTHTISIEDIACQHDRPSMGNWLDTWRPMAACQHSQDYLYLTPQGKPFTSDGLRQFLYKHAQTTIKGIFPGYYNYTSRHWCAIARLIRTKLESGHFDEFEVMEYLGHSKTDVTMTYLRRAKWYYEQTGYDWIRRVLRCSVGSYDGKGVVGSDMSDFASQLFAHVATGRGLPTISSSGGSSSGGYAPDIIRGPTEPVLTPQSKPVSSVGRERRPPDSDR